MQSPSKSGHYNYSTSKYENLNRTRANRATTSSSTTTTNSSYYKKGSPIHRSTNRKAATTTPSYAIEHENAAEDNNNILANLESSGVADQPGSPTASTPSSSSYQNEEELMNTLNNCWNKKLTFAEIVQKTNASPTNKDDVETVSEVAGEMSIEAKSPPPQLTPAQPPQQSSNNSAITAE